MIFVPQNLTIKKFAFVHFLLESQFWFPVWLIFLTQKGFDLATIVLADGTFRLTSVLFEFPMGLVGDRLGRKNTYILICILAIFTYLGITFISDAVMLFVVWIFWGIFWALYSGSPSAYIYELLLAENLERHSVKIFGFFKMLTNFAALFSHLIAGVLLLLRPEIPFVVNGLFALVALIIVFFLPKTETEYQYKKISAKKMLQQFFTIFKENQQVFIIVVLLALSLIYFWSPRILMQPLFLELNLSPIWVSVVYFFYSMAGVIAGISVNRIRNLLGNKNTIFSGFLIVLAGVIFIAFVPGIWALLFFPMLSFGYILSQTILEVGLHRELDNRFRASMLSTASFIGGIVIIFTRPGLGLISDKFTTPTAFLIWAGLGIILLFFYLNLVRKLPGKN